MMRSIVRYSGLKRDMDWVENGYRFHAFVYLIYFFPEIKGFEKPHEGVLVRSVELFTTILDSCDGNVTTEDGFKEDETIVNHFHGVSSSSEAHRDVCGQTDQGSWILLERAHVK